LLSGREYGKMTLQDKKMENVEKEFVLRYLNSKIGERRKVKEEYDRWKESMLKGVELCETINSRLKEKKLRFKPGVDRLYFDDNFSFQAINFPNKEDRNKYDVSIQIQPRENDNQTEEYVRPSLFNANVIFEADDAQEEKTLNLDVLGKGILTSLDPDVIHSCVRLESPLSPIDKFIVACSERRAQARCDAFNRHIVTNVPFLAADIVEEEARQFSLKCGNAIISIKISPSPNENESYVRFITDLDILEKKTLWFNFRIPDRKMMCEGFTFRRGSKENTFVSSGNVNIGFSNDIDIVDPMNDNLRASAIC